MTGRFSPIHTRAFFNPSRYYQQAKLLGDTVNKALLL